MAVVPFTRCPAVHGSPDPRSPVRVWTGGNPRAIGAFRVDIEPTSQPAPRAPERGHPNEYPHAGVRVAGD
jgi:hypothetical protein